MSAFIVLLRGVNVGKAKRVPMVEFRQLLMDLGCTAVSTLLNSGNAVVQARRTTAPKLATQVAAALQQHLGFEVPVVVKSAKDLDAIIQANPLAATATDPARLLVVFARDRAALEGLQPMARLTSPAEAFVLTAQAAYLHCPGGILDSKAGAALLGPMGKAVTTRNWATVLKLQALARQGAA